MYEFLAEAYRQMNNKHTLSTDNAYSIPHVCLIINIHQLTIYHTLINSYREKK